MTPGGAASSAPGGGNCARLSHSKGTRGAIAPEAPRVRPRKGSVGRRSHAHGLAIAKLASQP
jgi:hypothetical protein